MEDKLQCALCNHQIGNRPSVTLGEKGSESINRAGANRGLDIAIDCGQTVHTDCRRDFIHERNIRLDLDKHSKHNIENITLRSKVTFDFMTKCLFCGFEAKICHKKRGFDVFPVRTIGFQESVLKVCASRNDAWSNAVFGRISAVIDLPAAEARYHQTCNVNFRTNRQLPKQYRTYSVQTPGRPEKAKEAFEIAMKYLTDYSSGQTLTINDAVDIMAQHSDANTAYSSKHMKRKLQEYFGDSLTFSSMDGKSDIITLKETTSSIIHTFARESCHNNDETEKIRIIVTAAKLIKNDINSLITQKKFYPSPDDVCSLEKNTEFVPGSLKMLLQSLFSSKDSESKVGSIGQAIMQATRPRGIIAPLQIGLGVQMHRQFGSHFLVDTLNKLGFCSSYSEVQKYEMNSAKTLNTTIPAYSPGRFLQFVSDNVDHNVVTIDGCNTFHGMGTIACVTPGDNIYTGIRIPRNEVSLDDIVGLAKINIRFFVNKEHEPILFKPLQIQKKDSSHLDSFFHLLWSVVPDRPSWSGFMQLHDRQKPKQDQGVSTISFLPMIDLNPSDLNCVFSTMSFVCDLARQYDVTPVLTFDQPLFAKATYIAQCEMTIGTNIVLRLGPFHTQMSFLGSIGHIMAGSGLQELLETVYAPNAVTHMLSGKAVSRAMRGHLLVSTALSTLILKKTARIDYCKTDPEDPEDITRTKHVQTNSVDSTILPTHKEVTPSTTNEESYIEEIDEERGVEAGKSISVVYKKLVSQQIELKDICNETAVEEITLELKKHIDDLKLKNRTACLWLQYLDMISVLQNFIRAERLGDWQMHLSALREMLPFFAASGHNLYLKSAYIYLQNMSNLKNEHPPVYEEFMEGRHVVKRSDGNWSGLSTDLTIEQVLMRSLKTSGGLTRGRGMTEIQRSVWVMSMPATAQMNAAMRTYTESTSQTMVSTQHKDESKARRVRDEKDTRTIIDFLRVRNPFEESRACLQNIETGVTSRQNVNVDKAKEVGSQILEEMVGKSSEEYTFKRSRQVVTFADAMSIKIKDETLTIDPQLLFQRLITVARQREECSDIFKFELAGVPSSLFDNHGLLREPQKSILAETLWKLGNFTPDLGADENNNVVHVLDGGSLIQKIPWQKTSFQGICEQYLGYIKRKYLRAVVVFDGYKAGPSTKDVTHSRRTKGVTGQDVVFELATPFKGKKDIFLRNTDNKQHFIELLGMYLEQHDIGVYYASGDADVPIIQTAVEYTATNPVVVVGEDTDLLVLLCYHADMNKKLIIFRSDMAKKSRIWDILKLKAFLGPQLCSLLPFVHALSGCDTTSRPFGIGKAAVLKLLRSNTAFKEAADACVNSENVDEILEYGEKCMINLYDLSWNDSIDRLRFHKFVSKVASATSCVQVHSLPPTSDATSYHIRRVYLQSQTWMGNTNLNPCEWGWELNNNVLQPVKTKLQPAPQELLKVIRCTCKRECDSRRCTCRKHGLACSISCTDCRGVSCTNCVKQHESSDSEGGDSDSEK